MKQKCFFLACLLAISGICVVLTGVVVKYGILKSMGIHRSEPAVALPFLLLQDDGLRYVVTVMQQPTQPTQPPTEPPVTQAPTQPTQAPRNLLEKTLFIGDSRTCGLRDYARLTGADYFCDVGMSVFNAKEKRVSDAAFHEETLEYVLKSNVYSCVVITLGLNEAGYPMDSLRRAYGEFLTMVSEAQPGATIIVQGVMTVGRAWAEKGSHFSPENLAQINGYIRGMADGIRIYYIDPNVAFADKDGYLPTEMSADGCHLYAKYAHVWNEWLCQRIVNLDR